MRQIINFLIDESGEIDSNYFLVGCVLADDLSFLKRRINCLYKNLVGSPVVQALSKFPEFVKENFHFCSNDTGVKVKFLEFLGKQDIEGYVAYMSKEDIVRSGFSKNDLYDLLLTQVLTDRLRKYIDYQINIYVEQRDPSKINKEKEKIEVLIERIRISCRKKYFLKKDFSYSVNIVDKKSFITCIPDYFIGLIKFKLENNDPKDVINRNYKNIEGKIRLLIDVGEKKYISRKTRI